MEKCKSGIWLRAIDDDTNTVLFWYKPCKLKGCPQCSKEIKKAHKKRIMFAMLRNPKYTWFFVTTTGKSWWHKEHKDVGLDTLPLIRATWGKFRKRLSRSMGKDVLWMRVFEKHESGVWHVHAIIGTRVEWWKHDGIGDYVTQKRPSKRKQKRKMLITKKRAYTDRRKRAIKKHWEGSGGGYQIDLQPLDTVNRARRRVGYAIKYGLKTYIEASRVLEYCRLFPKLTQVEIKSMSKLKWEYLGKVLSGAELLYWYDEDYEIEIKGA